MFFVPFKNKCFNVRISEQINCKSQVLRIIMTHILTLLVHIKMLLIIHYKSPTALWLNVFWVSVNPSYCVSVPPFVSLFYFNTPAPFFMYAFGELYDLLNSFRMSNNRTCLIDIFSTKYIDCFYISIYYCSSSLSGLIRKKQTRPACGV